MALGRSHSLYFDAINPNCTFQLRKVFGFVVPFLFWRGFWMMRCEPNAYIYYEQFSRVIIWDGVFIFPNIFFACFPRLKIHGDDSVNLEWPSDTSSFGLRVSLFAGLVVILHNPSLGTGLGDILFVLMIIVDRLDVSMVRLWNFSNRSLWIIQGEYPLSYFQKSLRAPCSARHLTFLNTSTSYPCRRWKGGSNTEMPIKSYPFSFWCLLILWFSIDLRLMLDLKISLSLTLDSTPRDGIKPIWIQWKWIENLKKGSVKFCCIQNRI